jgi:hypothetical protein
VYGRVVGKVVSLEEYRARRDPLAAAVRRLDRAVRRLDPLVRGRAGALGALVERELVAIATAVTAGRPGAAAELAERLADRLEHPAALG